MDKKRWTRIELLFTEALELDREERAAFLEEACEGDLSICVEVEALLSASEEDQALAIEGRLLNNVSLASVDDDTVHDDEVVGPYLLEHCIGAGGMGEVYLAHRNDGQFEHQVALKLIHPGFRSKQVLARFRLERQVLARLSHPNITELLDGGIDEKGRPYFVMQYVKGVPITEYCDVHSLSINDRLDLFKSVCEAVQHAHRNLVVHRDLKPSNILVTEEGVVKLLDFGIAKILNPEWEKTMVLTHSEMKFMTPEYAAPEQVRGEAITTATDVYGLGVLLYEILTGSRPYKLKSKAPTEIERVICEIPPTRPSEVIDPASKKNGQLQNLEAIGQARRMGIQRLKNILRGDLDNIVLMALRKEPGRRYPTAVQFAEDINRFQKKLPVHAQRDSVTYRMEKFVQRHRLSVSFSVAAIAMLLAFSIFTSYQSQLVKKERDLARTEKVRAERVIGLLVSLFETANPAVVPGGDTLSVGEFVERGAEKSLAEVEDDPAVATQLKHTLGQMYAAQGQYKAGHQFLKEAYEMQESLYGPVDSITTAYLHDVATMTWRLGEEAEARRMFADLLERNQQIFGAEHPRVAQSMQNVALTTEDRDKRLSLLNTSLEMKRKLLPASHTSIADGLNQLAIFHFHNGDYHDALPMLQESLEIAEEQYSSTHPNTVAVMSNITMLLSRMGETFKAIDMQEDVIARLQTIKSDSSVQMSNAWNNLGVLQTNSGQFEEAEHAFRQALGIQEVLLGKTHPRVISTRRNVGVVLGLLEQYDEGIAILEQALSMKKQREGLDNLRTLGYMQAQYALLLNDGGYTRFALENANEVVVLLEETPQVSPTHLSDGLLYASIIYYENGSLEMALKHGQKAFDIRSELYDEGHPKRAQAQCIYGLILHAVGRGEEARELLHQGLPIYEEWPMANKNRVQAARSVFEGMR